MEAILDKEEDIKAEMNVFENHSHHPNIVNFFGAFIKKDVLADDQLWIVMEVRPPCDTTINLCQTLHCSGSHIIRNIK